jgi:CRISPR-associated protein Csa3
MVMSERKTLVATFGFDIDFVLRRISGRKYDKIILLSLKTPEGEKRVEKAYTTLKTVCISMGVDCALEWLTENRFVRTIYSILSREAGEASVELYLTGGPRILVVSALTAALMLSSSHAEKINMVVEGEAFEKTWEAPLKTLKKLVALDEKSREVIMHTAVLRRASLAELSRMLGLPKPTVLRRLRELMDKGVVCKMGDEYLLCPQVDQLL